MKNKKFIIYNKTKSFDDFTIFEIISDVLSKGLISGNNELYCYASTYFFEEMNVHIETIKTNYGYKIYVYEEKKEVIINE